MASTVLPSTASIQLVQAANISASCWQRSRYPVLTCRKLVSRQIGLSSKSSRNSVYRRRDPCHAVSALGDFNEVDASQKEASSTSSTGIVLVIGASGGVGQLIVASLLDRGFTVRALLRDKAKALNTIFRGADERLQVCVADLRIPQTLTPDVFDGVSHVICSCGTTAFPSSRWKDNNNPEQADWVAMKNLVAAMPRKDGLLKRFVMVSSIGVTRRDKIPFSILNLFGVLKFKKMGEELLQQSGVPYTIIRAGRLTDGPYTSYDLNTLLKGTAGTRRQVLVERGDKYSGETSRLVVAEACIQALALPCTNGHVFEVGSVEGEGPGEDVAKWEALFLAALA